MINPTLCFLICELHVIITTQATLWGNRDNLMKEKIYMYFIIYLKKALIFKLEKSIDCRLPLLTSNPLYPWK